MKQSGFSFTFLACVLVVLVSALCRQCASESLLHPNNTTIKKQPLSAAATSSAAVNSNQSRTSTLFRVGGSVFPDGHFYAQVGIGKPVQYFSLDVDTGSELTWIQSEPCTSCHKAPHKPYKYDGKKAGLCRDPLCSFVHHPSNRACNRPSDQCQYQVNYADQGKSTGVLVRDNIPMILFNRSTISPLIYFGSGNNQVVKDPENAPHNDGVLGLANSKISITSQLPDMGITKNVVAHCFGSTKRGGEAGYVRFGDDRLPSAGVVWVPQSKTSDRNLHYTIGPAELVYNGKPVTKSGFPLVLDSGSTYTYLNTQAYKATLDMIQKSLNPKCLKRVPKLEDNTLPVCWKGSKPFTSFSELRPLFKNLAFRFPQSRNAMLDMPPQSYLIISKKGNACLGILESNGAGGNLNIVGDISMLDKLVIYDNEKQQIGWKTADCPLPRKP